MAKSNMEMDSIPCCMICLDSPKNAVICRHCSQPFCSSCIDKQFAQNSNQFGLSTCPHCRKETKRNEFTKLVWYEDLLKWTNDKKQEFENTKMKKCSEHTEEVLSVYCSTCSKAICAQCISRLFNGKHIDHKYSRLDAAQQGLLKALVDQEKIRQSDLDKLGKCIENKKSIIGQILIRKQERYNELEQFQTKIKTEIDSQAMKIQKKFEDEQKVLEAEKTEYETRNVQLKKRIESCNQSDLFAQEKDLLERISRRPNIPQIDKINLSNDIIQSSLTLPWQTYEFLIEQFFIKQRNNNQILSPQFQLGYNQYWTLIIYPNGNDPRKGVYLSVMLQLNKGMTQSIDYNIIIELIHQHHDDNNYVFKCIQPFEEGQIKGFNLPYQLKDLFINGFIDTESDSIKFRVKLQPKSILEERKLLQWQIESFNKNERNWDEQNQEMNSIKSQLNHLRQDYKETDRIIKDQRNKIEELEKDNSELKRKRHRSNHNDRNEFIHQEDHRSNSDQTRIVVFTNGKHFRK